MHSLPINTNTFPPVSASFSLKGSQHIPLNERSRDPAHFLPENRLLSPVAFHIAEVAGSFWNRSSEDGPDQGNLACAYMVNQVLFQALGKKYGDDLDTVNSVWQDLLRQGGRQVPVLQALPGDIAISYNQAALLGIGGGTAHIGIFLTPNLIIANSSRNRRFNQIKTSAEFAQLYPYFEVIRPVEVLASTPKLSLSA